MASVGVGVTIGSHSLRAVKVRKKGQGFQLLRVFSDRLDDDVRPVAGRALAAKGFAGAKATFGLTGRDVIIRYSQVPPVPDWRLRNLMKFEVEEVGSQSGGDVSADYRKLNLPDPEGTRTEETILVALARNRHLDALLKSLGEGGIKPDAGCPNSVALFNAFAVNATYTEEETCLLVNVGAEDVDVAIQRGGELLFARNATPGAKAFTDAIANAFSTTPGKAEQMKLAKADVTPRGQARYSDSTAEKVANAIIGVAGQLASLIQSTLMIARAQTKLPDLKVDRVLLAGGGASLKGLDLYLKQAMGVPVERFNPFALCDLGALTDAERELVEKSPHEFAVVMGLAQASMAPGAFKIRVLPAAIRRRREFATRGVFGVLAGVVAAGILVVIHTGLASASAKGRQEESRLKRSQRTVAAEDAALRGVLEKDQELTVKLSALSDLAAPGDLLARVMDVVESNLSKDVFLHGVHLVIAETANEIQYVRPRGDAAGSGYEKTARTSLFRRDARVRVDGRITAGKSPAAVYQAFVQACEQNPYGLVVKPAGTWKPGAGGQDATFQLDFYPGEPVELAAAPGTQPQTVVLRGARVEGEGEEEVVVGRYADGTEIRLQKDQVSKKDWDQLVERLRARPK